jgi:hypothetical protein
MKQRPSLHSPVYVALTIMVSLIFLASKAAAEGIPLTSGVPATGSLGDLQYSNYLIDVSSEATRLTVTLTGDGGDLDLFVRYGQAFQVEYPADFEDFMDQADFLSIEAGSNEAIEVSLETVPPISAGTWYITPFNFENVETPFTLTATVEEGDTPNGTTLPLPSGVIVYDMYTPLSAPVVSVKPLEARPIGVGPAANGGPILNIQVNLAMSATPIDVYFGLYLPAVAPSDIFLLDSTGVVVPFSSSGFVPWAENVSDVFSEEPFGSFSTAGLPPGRYYLYLMVTPAGDLGSLYLWSTYFDMTGPPPSANTEPYLDIVVDNTVVDFGRLDGVRRNNGVGQTNPQNLPAPHPIPFPNLNFPGTPQIPDWGTYGTPVVFPSPAIPPPAVSTLCPVPGTSSPELLRLPIISPAPPPGAIPTNHFAPLQNPWGMTMVYAIVADVDSDSMTFNFVLPEPIMGKGNYYTAIPLPNHPIGTLIDSYPVMDAYNAALSLYANRGWLPIQPHTLNGVTTGFVSPVEPSGGDCRRVPWEFPYVIGFENGSEAAGRGIQPDDVVTEAVNPLGAVPSGTVRKVFVKNGDWREGDARGYLWMIPVDNDFWDPRHSTGVPALLLNGKQVATVSFVGQALPVIWEAPDDPDAAGTTHDRRHLDPQIIPRGGQIYLQAKVNDGATEKQDSEWVAYPDQYAAVEIEKTVYEEHNSGLSCPGEELVVGPAGTPVTYCFVVKNVGSTYLNGITIADTALGIPPANLTLLSGEEPLAPGDTLVFYFETTLKKTLTNTAGVTAIPCDADGNPIPGMTNPTDADTAAVQVEDAALNYPYAFIYLDARGTYSSKTVGSVYENISKNDTDDRFLAAGSFSGNTFTGTIKDLWDDPDSTYTGTMTVTVDPGTMTVTRFNVDEEIVFLYYDGGKRVTKEILSGTNVPLDVESIYVEDKVFNILGTETCAAVDSYTMNSKYYDAEGALRSTYDLTEVACEGLTNRSQAIVYIHFADGVRDLWKR